jgi:cytochrome bd-type quinol oxidase subunit 2
MLPLDVTVDPGLGDLFAAHPVFAAVLIAILVVAIALLVVLLRRRR